MYITVDTIIKFGALLGVICTCAGLLYKGISLINTQKAENEALKKELAETRKEIQSIKSENCAMCYAILAALDGLMQLGANGNVTHAHEELEKYLNKQAHSVE